MAAYCGSKAFVDHFAKCLAYENPERIDVLSYKPFTVQSNLVKMEPSFSVLTATEAASSALDKLGWDVDTEGHWRHKVVNFQSKSMMSLIPYKTRVAMLNKALRGISKARKEQNH